ncbi:uncharacterized protein KZ484_020913 [Pholidichthys leucotaenia]
MATYCLRAATVLRDVNLAPCRWLLSQTSPTPAVCPSLKLHVSPAAHLCSSRTKTQKSSQTQSQMAEEEPEGPEYIPRRKAKNPMVKVGIAWAIGLPTGIISFLLAKRQVDKNRLKQLKIRQRMRSSNEGEYESSRYHRYRHITQDISLER